MTVCAAAICEGTSILGASDRMLTAGDVQFEPQQPKVTVLTKSIVVLTAGDSALQAEIMQDVRTDVQSRVEAEPDNWWNVRDVADLYNHYCNRTRLRRAETGILAPLGLDANSFISRQREMDPQFIRQIGSELINFSPPTVESIICGVDSSGPHIYSVYNSDVTCQDTVGFAAIGVGAWHADSQFMFAGHVGQRPFPETLLLVYLAKKRAEVAPGVGEATDMFSIGPALGSLFFINEEVKARLEEEYRSMRGREVRMERQAQKGVRQYVEDIVRRAQAQREQAASTEDGGGDTPAD